MADHLRTELALEALGMALGIRRPEQGLVHHSDRGCQYASELYRAELAARGIVPSMSRVGDCWDNAVAESFFATLKAELIHRRPWPTKQEARTAIHDYIGVFYNPHRRHSSLGYLSPMDFESNMLPEGRQLTGVSTESGQLQAIDPLFSQSYRRSGTSRDLARPASLVCQAVGLDQRAAGRTESGGRRVECRREWPDQVGGVGSGSFSTMRS